MKKRKLLTASVLTLCAVALVAGSVLTTVALLTSSAGVSNTFTVGNVSITMDESKVNEKGEKVDASGNVIDLTADDAASKVVKVTANSYHLIPGETYTKDPTIHIGNNGDMDEMYLFVKSTNKIRSAEAGNYKDRNREDNVAGNGLPAYDPDKPQTPLSMREQMLANGWVEFVRSSDGVDIVWVYGERNATTGVITPEKVDKGDTNITGGTAGDFRLCEGFTVYQYAKMDLFNGAAVEFTAFAVQSTGFTGDTETGNALTKAAWDALKEAYPYQIGITSPVNPYDLDKTSNEAYAPVTGVTEPKFELLESLKPTT